MVVGFIHDDMLLVLVDLMFWAIGTISTATFDK